MAIIYQFQNNLRLKDNPSLGEACSTKEPIIPIYVLPKKLNQKHPLGFNYWSAFRKINLQHTLFQLNASLEKLGGQVYIFENLEQAWEKLSNVNQRSALYTSNLPGTYENETITFWESRGINTKTFNDYSLYDKDQLPFESLPKVFTHFRKCIEKNIKVQYEQKDQPKIDCIYINQKFPWKKPKIEIHQNSVFPYLIDEKNAQERIKDYFQKGSLDQYKKTRNGMMGSDYSSKLSPFLAHGVISPKTIWNEIEKFEKEVKKINLPIGLSLNYYGVNISFGWRMK